MTRSIRFAIGLAAVLLALASAPPPAAQALEFESTVPDQTFTVGTAVSLTLPRTKLEGQCYHDGSSYTLTPTLPAGLSFNGDYSSRLISGTPTTATAQTQYTYAASNNACYQNASANFNITVVAAPEITLSASSVSVTEGGTGTYTVRLKDQPTGNVTVTVSSGDSGAVTASPASLTFTTGNYSTTQTVTLTGAQDADGADETVTITHTASGGGITGKIATLTATVTDDDSLTAGSIGETSAILTNYKGSWYYKETAPSTGTCSSAGAGVSVSLTGLTAGTSYTYKAYSDSNCATETGSVTFSTLAQTTVPKMATPTLTGGNKRISLSWSYPQGVPGLQAYRVRYREKGQTDWTYADARSDSGEQNFYGHETGATIPAHETFTMKDSTTYQVQVRAGKWDGNYTGWGAWSDTAEAATNPAGAKLTAAQIGWSDAELRLANYTGDWYYKQTAPSTTGACSGPETGNNTGNTTVNLYSLDSGTPYTYKAYTADECNNDSFATASFTTRPPKVDGVQVTPRDRALAVSWTAQNHISSYRVQWRTGSEDWSIDRQKWVGGGDSTTTIDGLVNGTTYYVRVAAHTSGGGYWSDAATGTPAEGLALSAGSIEATTATLTLSNHSAAWYYKYTSPSGGQCSSEVTAGTTTASLTNLTQGTTYTFKAYSDSNCATELATAPDFITRPGQVTGVSAAAGDRSLSVSWSAVTGAASYKVQWKSGTEEYASSRQAAPTGTTHTIPSLTNDTQYTLRVAAVNASGDGAWSADATGTPVAVALTFSNATATSVRLNLANYTGVWHWKHTSPAGGQCSAAIDSGTSDDSYADATGLDAGTTYTFAVYADSACSATALVTGSVTTVPPKVAGVQATAATASLALSWTAAAGASDYVVQWKSGNQGWDSSSRQQVATSNSATISPLVNGVAHTVRVAARNSSGSGAWSDTATGTPSGPTLAASNVQATTATLTISGHSNAAWYYKYTVPATPAGSCSSVVASGTTTASLTGLTQGTTYTFAAYSDSNCATLLALAPAFLTRPGQVTGVAVEGLSGKLKVTWSEMARADSYKVQWKSGNQNYDSSREAPAGTSPEHTISNLTNNTTYTVRVAAVNASGAGAWSAEVTGTPSGVTLSAGSVATTTATLTIADHTGNWHYKYTSPSGGQCSAAQTGASAGVTNLKPNTSYTFAAYSDSNCATLLATASAFTTRAAKVTGVRVNTRNTGLKVSWNALDGAASYKVQWKSGHQEYGSSRQATATGTDHTITGLTNDTLYHVRVAAVVGGSDGAWSDEGTGTPKSVYLSADTVTRTTATLTLGGRSGNWWYINSKDTTSTCSNSGISGNTLSLTDLTAGTEYTIRAFSTSNCKPPTTALITTVTFSTAAAVTLTASSVEATAATLTIANHTGNWHYKANAAPHASCSSTAVSATSVNLSGLSTNTNYTYKAYSDSGCTTANLLATASTLLTKPGKPTTPAAATSVGSGKLTITASVTGSGTLSKWQYQQKEGGGNYGSWQDISSTSTSLSHTVSGLTNSTDYQFKVRAVNATGNGATSDASTAARPVAVTLGVTSRSSTTATLTLGGFAGSWWWTKDEESNCSNTGISGNTLSLTDLTKNTSYTIHAWPNSNCSPTSLRLTQHTFTTLASDATLAASSVEATTATLTISSYTGAWYYKYTAPSGGQCSSKIAADTSTASLTELAANTNHTFKAYNNSGCTTELTGDSTDAEFLTKPGKPAKPVAAAGAGSGKLTITASVTGDGTLSNWQYQQKAATDTDFGSWQNITSTSTSLSHTVSGLTDGTDYQFKVRAVNATGDGAASDASTAFPTLPPKPAKPTATAGSGSGELVLASSVGGGSAAITGWKYKKKDSDWDDDWTSINSTSKNLSYTVTGLTNDTDYKFKVLASNASGDSAESDESDAAQPKDETLAVSSVGATSATLTIGNWPGNWHYKHTSPSNGTCSAAQSSASATATGLTANTSYTFAAYSDSGCNTALATATAFATLPPKPAKPVATAGSGSGRLVVTSSVTGTATLTGWEYKKRKDNGNYDADWTSISSTSKNLSHAVTGLTDDSNYQFKVRAKNASGEGAESDASTAVRPLDETLAVSGITTSGATLTISNWPNAWRYKYTSPGGGQCSSEIAAGTAAATVGSLDANTAYTFKAYSDSSCNTELAAAAAFPTKPPKPAKPTAVSGAGSGKLTLSSSVTGTATLTRWEYKQKETSGNFPGNWTPISNSTSTTLSHTISGLDNTKTYQFKVRARNASGDSAESDVSDSAQPADETLAASSITTSGATLEIGNWPNAWRYKYTSPSGGQCSSEIAGGTLTAAVTGLDANTSYTFKAYSDSNCNTVLATTAFPTLPPKPAKPTATAGSGSGELVLAASVGGGSAAITGWKYKKKDSDWDDDWTSINSTSKNLSYTVTGLTNDTDYKFKVLASNASGDSAESDESDAAQPKDETLAVSSVGATSATLTIGNWPGNWHYKHTSPSNGTCSAAQSSASATATGLTANTSYTFAAYSDSGCNTALATATAFATLPPKPDKPTATRTGQDGELTLASSLGGGSATLTRWEYIKKKGSGNWETNWTQIASTSKTLSHTVTGLDRGENYQFKVRAVNASGAGADSDASASAATPTPPLKPTGLSGKGANTSATITWTSGGDGGSAITRWQYVKKEGSGNFETNWTDICTSSDSTCPGKTSHTVGSLTNGTDYKFKVRAVNAVGDGAESDESAAVRVADVPPKPATPSVSVSGPSVTLTLSIQNDSGADVTSWEYIKKGGGDPWETTWKVLAGADKDSSSATVSGLIPGVAYRFRIRAVNSSGAGAASDESSKAVARQGGGGGGGGGGGDSAPNAPIELSAAAGDRSVTLTWVTGGDGGSSVTAWQYRQSADGGAWGEWIDICLTERDTACPSRTSHVITGLANGVTYRFQVRAVNANGAGAESPESNAVQAPGEMPPEAPGKPSVSAGNGAVTLSWTAAGDGGSPVTEWAYRQKRGDGAWGAWTALCSAASDADCAAVGSYTVTGLSNGVSYRFQVRASNAAGAGAASPQSDSVAPLGTPAAPTDLRIEAGYAQLTLSWTAGSDGGSPVTGWQYRQKAGSGAFGDWTDIPGGGDVSSHTMTGLANGTAYRFQVRGVNAAGAGAASPQSDSVAPLGTPAAPTDLRIEAGYAQLTLSWTAGSDGGSPVTGWQYRQKAGSGAFGDWTDIPGGGDVSSHTMTGLANGTAYRFQVRGVNAAGAGAASPQSDSVAPLGTPAAPTDLRIEAGYAQLTLSWTAGSDGGSPVTEWAYRQKRGDGAWGAWTALCSAASDADCAAVGSYTVTGLSNGVSYRFQVRASNAAGAGAASPQSDSVAPLGTPAAPTDLRIEAGYAQLTLSWTAGSDGGSPVTEWAYRQKRGDGAWGAWTALCSAASDADCAAVGSYTVTGLSNGVSYRFQVRASNAAGAGAASPQSDSVAPLGTPAAPTDLRIEAGYAQLTLSWTAGSDGGSPVTGWQYRQKAGSGAFGDWTDIPGGGDVSSHTMTGLANGTAYRFQVRGVNAAGAGAASPQSAAGTPVDSVPDFGDAAVADLRLEQGVAMQALVLPEASGGDGALSYALSGELPAGLAFDAATRTLSGVPAQAMAARSYEYTATDSDLSEPDVATLSFTIAVEASAADAAVLERALAAQGRAMLTSATSAIGERFRAGLAAQLAGASEPNTDRTTEALNFLATYLASQAGGSGGAGGMALSGGSGMAGFGGAGMGAGQGSAGFGQGTAFGANAGFGQGAGMGAGMGSAGHGIGGGFGGGFGADMGFDPTGPFGQAGGAGRGRRGAAGDHRPDWSLGSLIQGRSFAVPLNAASGGGAQSSRWTAWGAADLQTFNNAGEFDGSVSSLYLGADLRFGGTWMGGAALALSQGDTDYTAGGRQGRLETQLAAIHPYVRGETEAGMELWAIGGFGMGEAEEETGAEPTDLDMTMAAAGMRLPLRKLFGMDFSLVGAAGQLSLSADDAGGVSAIEGLDVAVSQGRLGVEISMSDSELSPYLRLGGRGDGGDGLTGSGVEVAGGLRYAGERVDFEAQGRWLGTYSESEYEEYGGMARLVVKSRADGSGLSLSLSPSWGQSATGALLSGGDGLLGGPAGGALPGAGFGGAAPGVAEAAALSLDSQLGYGFVSSRLKGLLTPVVSYTRAGVGGESLKLGLAYQSLETLLGSNFALQLAVGRESSAAHIRPDYGALLTLSLRPWGAAPSATNLPSSRPGTTAGAHLTPRPAPRPQPAPTGAGGALSAPESASPNTESASAKTPAPESRPPEALAPAVSMPERDSHAWLLAEPPTHYAVQLIAFEREAQMDAFVTANVLHDLPRACVQRDGKVFHVLLLGVYATREAAQRAADGRPEPLGNLTPWIRSMGSLQQAAVPASSPPP